MSRLTPEERNQVISEIQRLAGSLREDEYGIEITGCREALGVLAVAGLLSYILLSFSGIVLWLLMGIILGITILSVVMFFVTRLM